MIKTPVKFQKDWSKTVGRVTLTRYLLQTRNQASRKTHHRKPNTMSPCFSSKRQGTKKNFLLRVIPIWKQVLSFQSRPLSLFLFRVDLFSEGKQRTTLTDHIPITKTRLYNVDPLQPHFHIAKLGFTGVYINFLISAQKHRLWVLVTTTSPRRF